MQNNIIYNMDKKSFFSDSSNMSGPSPNSSPSSMSSGYTSNTGVVDDLPMNFHDFNLSSDINMTYSYAPLVNVSRDITPLSERIYMNQHDIGAIAGYTSQLVILEEPTEKFRFRYKSEMHGTHGSLNGVRSEKNKKTFPEVELRNFSGTGVIRCSLYQTNIDKPSPHSHQLVVRKDEVDECDPHDLNVSPEKGYIARFENMGIIHTAKKNICDALYAKKKKKLIFEMGGGELSQKQEKAMKDEAEREGKLMNLNQVRLCFEAFQVVEGGAWSRICEPIFSRPINNRKSALTGELKICRLSAAVGNPQGKDDLILLVEKVSKKNIQVRFYELCDDDLVWEAFGVFSDADVHHQYAIVVRTPPYKNTEIDRYVDVLIELVRKSDDERSAPLSFRYKANVQGSRKRRRTSHPSTTSSSVSSSEIPETVHAVTKMPYMQFQQIQQEPQTISQEFDKDKQLNALFENYMLKVSIDSDLFKPPQSEDLNELINMIETDGEAATSTRQHQKSSSSQTTHMKSHHQTLMLLKSVFVDKSLEGTAKIPKVLEIFEKYTANSDSGDTIVHEIVKHGPQAEAKLIFEMLSRLYLNDLFSQKNHFGQTPLHVACLYDNPVFIRPLLGCKCDPNVQDNEGNTALHIAISENLRECLDSFVSYISNLSTNSSPTNININLSNDNGLTPLHLAIRKNNINFVYILVTKCNASVKVASSLDGNNALHLAVQLQDKDMVKCLLENSKTEIKSKNRSGHTAIDLAKGLSGEVKKEILDLLLKQLPSSNDATTESIKDEPDDDNVSSAEEEDDKSFGSETEERNAELLKRLLQDEKVCSRLAQLLNVNDNWKKLATELNLNHMIILFRNAEGMLRYLAKSDEVNASKIINALQTVDVEAASIATSLMKI